MAFPLYLDADVHPIVARILRGRGFDAVSANEAGHRQASDREQLDFAVAHGRALVTFNVADFAVVPQFDPGTPSPPRSRRVILGA